MTSMTVAPSLFEGSPGSVLGAASDWLTGTLFGTLAVSLCIIAVAIVGLLLMTGRLAVREGLLVAMGCFVLLGAPAIAAGLQGVARETAQPPPPQQPVIAATPVPPPLPPSNYDPYAGASLRTD